MIGRLLLQPGSSTIAGEVDALFNFILYTGIIIFCLVIGTTAFFVIKYRRRKLELTTGKAHNTSLEIIWTVIPMILVLVVFIWSFKTYLRMSVVPKDAIEIKATGQRWFWSFDYPEGAGSVNELVVPVNKPVKILLSSQDVIHSFYVPSFRVKMDAVPSRYTYTWFEATETGNFNLFCAEYCGTGHSKMIGKVRVVGEKEYNDWIDASAGSGEGMTLEEFGATLYQTKVCITCHSIDGKPGTAPTFKELFGTEQKLTDGNAVIVDENYIRESILQPQAKVVFGFQPVMPTYQSLLRERQIDALIAYIKSLRKQ